MSIANCIHANCFVSRVWRRDNICVTINLPELPLLDSKKSLLGAAVPQKAIYPLCEVLHFFFSQLKLDSLSENCRIHHQKIVWLLVTVLMESRVRNTMHAIRLPS